MKGFKVEEFDPAELRRDGSRLVLVVKSNQVERYVEEDENVKTPPRHARSPAGLDQRRTPLADCGGRPARRHFRAFAIDERDAHGHSLRSRSRSHWGGSSDGCNGPCPGYSRSADGLREDPFHMTLAFLGDVRGSRPEPPGRELVAASVAGSSPVELDFEGLGAFPSPRRPSVSGPG